LVVALPAFGLSPAAEAQEVSRDLAVVRTGLDAQPHRFFDGLNLALTAVESGALLADGVYTQKVLRDYPGLGRERDPLARPFVEHGWPGQIVGGLLVVGADVGIRYLLHRHNHHRIERWMPMILTSYGLVGAVHNARLLGQLNREYEVR
jgi:hypothetical protein